MLLSLASALPPRRLTQAGLLEFFESRPRLPLRPESRRLLRRVLGGDSGIDSRHCAIDPAELDHWDAQRAARRYEELAPALAARAVATALERADLPAAALDGLLLSTCTGALCPGPSTHVAELLGLRPDAQLGDCTGYGCAAALPTLRLAQGLLALDPRAAVAVVAVELCSTTFFLDDDAGQLISLCLFGDGAAALILVGPEHPAAARALGRFGPVRSLLQPAHREQIRLAPAPGGQLRNQLGRGVPELAAAAVAELFRRDPPPPGARLVPHGGGREVLAALRRRFPAQPLEEAAAVLRQCGNLSSPSLFFALERALASAPKDPLWLTGFGAGFSAHAARFDPVSTVSS